MKLVMGVGPEGVNPGRGVPCGDDSPFTLKTDKPIRVDLGAPIQDPAYLPGILVKSGMPEPLSRALVSGLTAHASAVAKLPTDMEAIIAGSRPTETLQLGLVLLSTAQNGALVPPGDRRNEQIVAFGNNVISCFRADQARPYSRGATPCGDSLDSYMSAEQAEVQTTLVERLAELGKSLHLTDSIARIVADGLAGKREELLAWAQSGGDNTALIGSVMLAQINQQHTRPLNDRELYLRGSETGSLVVQLLAVPKMVGWSLRYGDVIHQMHTFNP